MDAHVITICSFQDKYFSSYWQKYDEKEKYGYQIKNT